MAKSMFFVTNAIFLSLLLSVCIAGGGLEANSNLFREYIGAQFNGVKFSDVPINPNVQFHFILAFAIDYTSSESPTNGKFNIFWDQDTLTPSAVQAIKAQHKNVKVAVSLGGDTVGKSSVVFNPTSVSSWVNNAVTSLTKIVKEYHLDGIDIDYEHFGSSGTPEAFADAIGELISKLKQEKVISFASIAPFDGVQSHYVALWNKHARLIDYVNFQFYSYSSSTTVAQFISLYDQKASLYKGGRVLASFSTDSSGGLKPKNGFFTAAKQLKSSGKLPGIFVWSADNSKASSVKFQYEKEAQELLAAKSSQIKQVVAGAEDDITI